MEILGAILGLALIGGFYFIIYSLIYQSKTKSEKRRIERNQKQAEEEYRRREAEKEVEKAILSGSQEYSKNIHARIDFEEFADSGYFNQSQAFAKYLSEVCEETIPTVSEFYEDYHPDKNYVSSEVASFFYFASYQLLRASGLDERQILTYWEIESEKRGRDSETFWNRKMIYEDIFMGAQVRAFWDPSGERIKSNTNELIFCFMALADFIWEPHMKDVTEHDDYIRQPLTLKSIEVAQNFNLVYEFALIQTCYFIELISNTAFKLKLIEK